MIATRVEAEKLLQTAADLAADLAGVGEVLEVGGANIILVRRFVNGNQYPPTPS